MKLLIISDTPHSTAPDGSLCGWAPTVMENMYIATLFTQTRVIGALYSAAPTKAFQKYDSDVIQFTPIVPSGGSSVFSKMKVLFFVWHYLKTIAHQVSQLNNDDWIYVRCPCNIGLIALFYLSFFKTPARWVKYAGNWHPPKRDALSYQLQRWILQKNFCKSVVTINGEWPGQPKHIVSFLNPSFKAEQIFSEPQTTKGVARSNDICKMLFVGRIESEKGLSFLLTLAEKLCERKFPFTLDIVGDGKDEGYYRKQINQPPLNQFVTFHGEKSRAALSVFYRKSHLLVFPSHAAEGWPKVLSEAMAHGCVPVASDISSIPQILKRLDAGISLSLLDMELWIKTIMNLMEDRHAYDRLSQAGIESRYHFTYETMVQRLKEKVILIPAEKSSKPTRTL